MLRKTGYGDNTTAYLKVTGSGNTGWKAVPTDIAELLYATLTDTAPLDGDAILFADSSAPDTLVKIAWSNIKTALAAIFAPLRPAPVQTVDVTNRTTVSPSYPGTGVQATITPSSPSARIKVKFIGYVSADTGGNFVDMTLFRDATDLTPAGSTASSRCG